MKNLIIILAVMHCSLSFAQTQFDYMGGFQINAYSSGCFYMDLNTYGTNTGENDVKMVHNNGDVYFEALYTDSILMPVVNGYMWEDCDQSNELFVERAYVIRAGNTIGIGNHVLKFSHSGKLHYLVVNVISEESVIIRGWVFNIESSGFECYEISSTVGISELILADGSYTEFNLLQHPADENTKGLIIRNYSNGSSVKIYR